jgi:hypothetical protein
MFYRLILILQLGKIMIWCGMVSTWLFAAGLGLALVFAFISFETEMAGILSRKPLRLPVYTTPRLPFFMSERFMCITALSLSLFVVTLTP